MADTEIDFSIIQKKTIKIKQICPNIKENIKKSKEMFDLI